MVKPIHKNGKVDDDVVGWQVTGRTAKPKSFDTNDICGEPYEGYGLHSVLQNITDKMGDD